MIEVILLMLGISGAVCLAVTGYKLNQYEKKLENYGELISRLANKYVELREDIERVDTSTGKDVYDLRSAFESFKTEYGDSAIVAQKETARAEKAWADGVNNIISYSPVAYGRGDKE